MSNSLLELINLCLAVFVKIIIIFILKLSKIKLNKYNIFN